MKAISLFSGMGGDTLGIEKSGIEVVAFNDFNKTAVNSHKRNSNSKLLHEDILDITKIPDSVFLELAGQINLIFAGFPCQGFSHGGKKLPDDPRNTLFKEFVRATEIVQPEFIIGENVEGLLSRTTPNGEKYIDIIQESFEEIGYKIKYKVIKSEDCGVPQLRRRLIIIGVHNLLDYDYEFPEEVCCCGNLNFLEETLKGSVCISGIYPVDKCKKLNPIHIHKDDREENDSVHPYILSIINKEPVYMEKHFDCLLSYGKRESPIHLEIVDREKPSKTIICTYNHQPRLLVPLKYDNKYYIRPYTVHELKQIQGFPKEFEICGNTKEQIIQIGNAVPPGLVEHILKPIISFMTQ